MAFCVERDEVGRLSNTFKCDIRYADNLAYEYSGCLINTMQWTINQSEVVNVTIDVIGGADSSGSPASVSPGNTMLRTKYSPTSQADNLTKFLSPARVVTWNDARIGLWEDRANDLTMVDSAEIREFTCSINNNIDRFYTLNNRLAPQDIAAKKREISGTLKLMGHNQQLSTYTQSHENRFTSEAGLAFGYALGTGVKPYWATALYGVIFEIEEVSLSAGLFETSTKWRALGDCTNSFLATRLGASENYPFPAPSNTNFGNTISPNFGNTTSPNYPQFSS